jgi:hypothetical protein
MIISMALTTAIDNQDNKDAMYKLIINTMTLYTEYITQFDWTRRAD